MPIAPAVEKTSFRPAPLHRTQAGVYHFVVGLNLKDAEFKETLAYVKIAKKAGLRGWWQIFSDKSERDIDHDRVSRMVPFGFQFGTLPKLPDAAERAEQFSNISQFFERMRVRSERLGWMFAYEPVDRSRGQVPEPRVALFANGHPHYRSIHLSVRNFDEALLEDPRAIEPPRYGRLNVPASAQLQVPVGDQGLKLRLHIGVHPAVLRRLEIAHFGTVNGERVDSGTRDESVRPIDPNSGPDLS